MSTKAQYRLACRLLRSGYTSLYHLRIEYNLDPTILTRAYESQRDSHLISK